MSLIPTRLLIQQRLQELLQTLVMADEETVDLTGAVFRGISLFGEARKPLPALSILESPNPDIASYAGDENFNRRDHLTVLITGMVEDDQLAPGDEAHYLCAAVEQRLNRIVAQRSGGRGAEFPEHFMLGNLITSLEIAPPVIRPPDDKLSKTAFFFLPIRLGIAVKIGQPYTTVV